MQIVRSKGAAMARHSEPSPGRKDLERRSSLSPSVSAAPGEAAPGPPTAQEPAAAEQSWWDWLTFIALSVLIYHVLALWYRWLRPDPDFLAFTGAVAELLAIGSFLGLQTERGRQLALRVDRAVVMQRLLSTPRRICLVAWLAAALAALLLYGGSPLAARLFNVHGNNALEEGRYSVAIRDFRRSASLAPGNPRTHYNLASVYAYLHESEQAIEEYQLALELDETFYPTYNNLGRLYLEVRHDPDAALAVLLAGRQRVDDPLGRAIIGGNIAWAYLDKGLPRTALSTLDEVRETLYALQDQGKSVEIYLAKAFRLEARAHQVLDQPDEARRAWQDCLGYALAVAEADWCVASEARLPPYCLDARNWAAEARERLAEE